MLKALELAGFKSFADRTRFDFPDGITVIVGPNGSGKSNVVDAIKWVLGSQSAKALRGKDMSDVIFKGAQGRGAAGTAEATIVFDNTTAAEILASVRAQRGRTVVMISHQLSAAASADRVLVLDDGRLVQQGRHQELLAQPGTYRRLWERQQADQQLQTPV